MKLELFLSLSHCVEAAKVVVAVDVVAVNVVVVVVAAVVFGVADVAIIINLKNVDAVSQHIDYCLFLSYCFCLGTVKLAMSD